MMAGPDSFPSGGHERSMNFAGKTLVLRCAPVRLCPVGLVASDKHRRGDYRQTAHGLLFLCDSGRVAGWGSRFGSDCVLHKVAYLIALIDL